MDWLQNLDSNAFLYLNSFHSDFGDSFCVLFTGRFIWIPMYAAMVYTLFRCFRWQQAVIFIIGVAAMILATDQICSHLLRPIFERPRPSADDSPIADMVVLAKNYRAGGHYGFPSCHAANTMALAMFMTLVIRRLWVSVFLFLWALMTCYTRIYLGAHYPGDLFVGSLIGIIIAWVIYLLCRCFIRVRSKHRRYTWPPSYTIIATGVLTILYMLIISL